MRITSAYVEWPQEVLDGPITADHRLALEIIERDVLDLDSALERTSHTFRLAVLVIAGASLVGPSVERLVALTGYPIDFVADVCKNMRGVGLWTDKVTFAEWLDEECNLIPASLWCQTLVADGKVTAWEDPNRSWMYSASPMH